MIGQVPPRGPKAKPSSYQELEASALFCPTCNRATPVRKRLLLVLPEGDLYEYLCGICGTSVGEKIDKVGPQRLSLVI